MFYATLRKFLLMLAMGRDDSNGDDDNKVTINSVLSGHYIFVNLHDGLESQLFYLYFIAVTEVTAGGPQASE